MLQAGKALDLPVYFGDAGSSAVLHSLGAEHAACAVITLDTPGVHAARPTKCLSRHPQYQSWLDYIRPVPAAWRGSTLGQAHSVMACEGGLAALSGL